MQYVHIGNAMHLSVIRITHQQGRSFISKTGIYKHKAPRYRQEGSIRWSSLRMSSTGVDDNPILYLEESKQRIAYKVCKGQSPGVMFLHGYESHMSARKALALQDYCRRTDRAYTRFDYSGRGSSDGSIEHSTLGQWKDDALAILDHCTTGPQILVGSSIGGWLSLLVAEARHDRICGLVGVATAADITVWRNYSDEVKKDLQTAGVAHFETQYGKTSITQKFISESKSHCLLNLQHIPITCPVRLIHGMCDTVVPYDITMQLADKLQSKDLDVILRKSGEHHLSSPSDLKLIMNVLDELIHSVAIVPR